jgi:hypothetical protein
MSKKFIVETDDNMDKDDVSTCLHNMDHYAFGTFKVTELSPVPEVKKIETGVLMSPAEITNLPCVKLLEFETAQGEKRLSCDNNNIGARLNLTDFIFPREFYRDIKTSCDFNSIPVGSLIKVEIDSCWMVGYYMGTDSGYLKVSHGNMKSETTGMHAKQIKSIRIIELPQGESK